MDREGGQEIYQSATAARKRLPETDEKLPHIDLLTNFQPCTVVEVLNQGK